MKTKDVWIVAGGTGGHLYPGIALADALRARFLADGTPTRHVLFVVRRGDLGKAILEKQGYPVIELSGQGLPRTVSFEWITFPWNLTRGFIEAAARLRRSAPSVVVGMGGYLTFPVLVLARAAGIPTLIHEQNAVPGLANRLLSHLVDAAALSFPESAAYFPKRSRWVSGLPVRSEFGTLSADEGRRMLGLEPSLPTLLVFGGSLGAHRLNLLAADAWEQLKMRGIQAQVLHITGEADAPMITKRYQPYGALARVMAYCHSMAAALAAADLVVCRAGASSIAELMVTRRPALLVPYPYASNNHQLSNAQLLVKQGAAEILPEVSLTPARLAERVAVYLQGAEQRRARESRLPARNEAASKPVEELAAWILRSELL